MKTRRFFSAAVVALAIALAYFAGTQKTFTPSALAQVGAQMTPTPSPTPTSVPPVTPAPQ